MMFVILLLLISLSNISHSFAPILLERREVATASTIIRSSSIPADPTDSNFGRQDYWNGLYEKESNFSWYAGWDELKPFVTEFVPSFESSLLIPGVGNDKVLVDMYQYGYSNLTAMDYAPEGIERCRDMLLLRTAGDGGDAHSVQLVVADARNLQGVFDDASFDAVMEKGTLDAIYLSGGKNKTLAADNLLLAINELTRCVKPGGIWISIAGVVNQQIHQAMNQMILTKNQEDGDNDLPMWTSLVGDGELYTTQDGYTSNNIDGSLLVWKKNKDI